MGLLVQKVWLSWFKIDTFSKYVYTLYMPYSLYARSILGIKEYSNKQNEM